MQVSVAVLVSARPNKNDLLFNVKVLHWNMILEYLYFTFVLHYISEGNTVLLVTGYFSDSDFTYKTSRNKSVWDMMHY